MKIVNNCYKLSSMLIILCLGLISVTQSNNKQSSSSQLQVKAPKQSEYKFPFQKIIWTVYHSNYEQAPQFVKICVKNMQWAANEYGFQFHFVNPQNLHQFLSQQTQLFLQIRKNTVQQSFVHYADLLRLFLLTRHGGIWVDVSSLFIKGLDDLVNIMHPKFSKVLLNKFSQEPDILLLGSSIYVNHIITHMDYQDQHHNKKTILYDPYPDYQGWGIAAKKNTSFMRFAKAHFINWTVTWFPQIQNQFMRQNIFIKYADNVFEYLYINLAIAYSLQKFQLQLDKNLSIFNLSARKYAHQTLKIWGGNSELGPLMIIQKWMIKQMDLFQYSFDELQVKTRKIFFWFKFISYYRNLYIRKIDYLIDIFSPLKRNLTFQQFMRSEPTLDQCLKISFIVQNSIMEKILKQIKFVGHYRIITKAQLYEWNQYCSNNRLDTFQKIRRWAENSYFLQIIKPIFIQMDTFPNYHTEELIYDYQVSYENRPFSYKQLFIAKFKDYRFAMVYFGIILLWVLIIMKSYKWLTKLSLKFWDFTMFNESSGKSLESSSVQLSQYSNRDFQKRIPQNKSNKPSSNQLYERLKSASFIQKLITILVIVDFIGFFSIDLIGGRQQPKFIFFVVLFTIICQIFIQKTLKIHSMASYKQSSPSYLSQKDVIRLSHKYQILQFAINYIVVHISIVKMMNHKFPLMVSSLIISQCSTIICKYYYTLKNKHNTKFFFLDLMYGKLQNIHRYIGIIVVGIYAMQPNLYYLANDQGYIAVNFPKIAIIYVGILYLELFFKSLEQNHFYDSIRLLCLPIISFMLWSRMVTMTSMTSQHNRVNFIIVNLIIFNVIYQQLGASLKINNETNWLQIQKLLIIKSKFKIVLFFLYITIPMIVAAIYYDIYWKSVYQGQSQGAVTITATDYLYKLFYFGYLLSISSLFMKIRLLNQQKRQNYQSNQKQEQKNYEIVNQQQQ